MADIKLEDYKNGTIYIRSNVDIVDGRPTKFILFFSQGKDMFDNEMIFFSNPYRSFEVAELNLPAFKKRLDKFMIEAETEDLDDV